MTARALAAVVVLGAVACGGADAEPPPPRGTGEVRIATVADAIGPGAALTSIAAHFVRYGTHTSCSVTLHGSCALYDCVDDVNARTDAGELDVTTADGRFTQKLLPDDDGFYSFGDETDLFLAGDELTASFAGGGVPAFAVVGIFPEPVLITEPAAPGDGGEVSVPRGADLTVRWTGGAPGDVVSVSQDAPSAPALRCTAAVQKGVLVVPAAALGELAGARLDLRTVRTVAARPTGYDVTLVLLTAGVDADGNGVPLALDP